MHAWCVSPETKFVVVLGQSLEAHRKHLRALVFQEFTDRLSSDALALPLIEMKLEALSWLPKFSKMTIESIVEKVARELGQDVRKQGGPGTLENLTHLFGHIETIVARLGGPVKPEGGWPQPTNFRSLAAKPQSRSVQFSTGSEFVQLADASPARFPGLSFTVCDGRRFDKKWEAEQKRAEGSGSATTGHPKVEIATDENKSVQRNTLRGCTSLGDPCSGLQALGTVAQPEPEPEPEPQPEPTKVVAIAAEEVAEARQARCKMLGQVAEVSKSCGTPGESDKREHNMILYINTQVIS